VANLNGLAWWAVIIFLWLAGIELDLKSAWAGRRETAITAGFALATPLLVGAVAAWGLLQWMPGLLGPKASELQFIAALGMGAAVTALPILMLLMEKLGILRTPLGQRVLRYSSLDDIAIWVVLALILVDTDRLLHQVLFLAGFGLLAPLVRRGLIIDRQWFVEERFDLVRNTVLVFMMPVFFLSTGLRTEWGVGGAAVLVAAAVMLAASVAGKRLGVAIAGRLLGWRPGEAYIIGWLLQTKALIEIIFATILLDKGVISADAFTALLLMAVASTMLTIPMLRRRLGREGVPEALRQGG